MVYTGGVLHRMPLQILLTYFFLWTGFVVEHSDIVFIAVKPQILDSAIENMKATLTQPVPSKLFVSVLAGTTLEVLEQVGCLLI
jgi:hypothetical protein